jgi:hypothetical protein
MFKLLEEGEVCGALEDISRWPGELDRVVLLPPNQQVSSRKSHSALNIFENMSHQHGGNHGGTSSCSTGECRSSATFPHPHPKMARRYNLAGGQAECEKKVTNLNKFCIGAIFKEIMKAQSLPINRELLFEALQIRDKSDLSKTIGKEK